MAYKVVIQPTAQRERESITAYLAQFGINTVRNFLNEYEHQLILLREGLVDYGLSRFEPLAQLGYHMAPVNDYLFLYFIEDNTLTIAHFFHQTQDYAHLVEYGV